MSLRSRAALTVVAVLLAFASIVAAVPAAAQDRVTTLRESVDLILKNSRVLEAAAETVSGAEAKVTESKSLYWPMVNFGGSYTRQSLISEFTMPLNGVMTTFKFGAPNSYAASGSIVEQVFNWGRTAKTVELSRAGLDLARDGESLAQLGLAYQAVPLYYGVVFFREAIRVLDDAIRQFERKAAIVEERYRAGLASSFDRSLLEVQISAVKAQRLDFENNIGKFRATFNSLAGRAPEAAFEPDAALAVRPVAADVEALIGEALGNRVELKQAGHKLSLNRASLDLARTANKPTLVFAFNYLFRNGFLPEVDKIRGNWTANLQISYPVFDGFRTGAQVAQAEVNIRAADLRREETERAIALEVRNALADLKTIEAKLEIEKAKIRQAEDALRIAEERYGAGLMSATDLVDAQNALENARLNALQLVYGHVLGTYALDRACGRNL